MKDPLYGNKIAAVALTTVLLAFGLPITINTLGKIFGGHHGHHTDEANPFGLAYIPTEIKLEGPGAAPPEPEVDLGTLLAQASAERGKRGAALCSACHTFEKGGPNGIGPNLWDVMGREVASVAGFSYSAAVENFGGVWSYERLDPYLENSGAYIPGTQMVQMLRKDQKRADILAYLATLSDDPLPFPEPAPPVVEEEVAEAGEEMDELAADNGAADAATETE
ncbi:MAG: cytochrome c family protein [Pseudomonadota bacterium]